MGLGTLVLLVNVLLIWAYTLGCHSCRHVVGGRLRHFSKHPMRYRAWTLVSRLNATHARYAWLSLFSVAIADFYVYLLATGAISDLRFFCHDAARSAPPAHTAAGPGVRNDSATDSRRATPDDRQPHGCRCFFGAGEARVRRRRDRRRWCRSARRHRGSRRRGEGRRGVQVAARQGAHRHGRGRHRGGDGQPVRRGQLAGALPRHHARREDAEQLADGAAARAGGPRARARARGVGRSLRPHPGRPDLPARLRRPPLRPARPRR